MDRINELLEGMKDIQTGLHIPKVENWDGNFERYDYALVNPGWTEATNIEIKTRTADFEDETLAEADRNYLHYVVVDGGTEKLIEAHEKQLRQALEKFDGWKMYVRVRPMLRWWIDEATGATRHGIRTRLVGADLRETVH